MRTVDPTFYLVPCLMALAGTVLLVTRGILKRESPLQILSDSVLSVVVALMFLAQLVTRWWIPLSIAGAALLLKIFWKLTRPKTGRAL